MARPNLEDPDELKAYRKELRKVGQPLSLTGMVLMFVGLVLLGANKFGWLNYHVDGPDFTAFGILVAGWGFLVWALFKRNIHHRNRMAEPSA
ncbi:MAG: hypothetical protein K1X35_01235 [Caulobacteraceae bacterium]|nr:hypothetical protein [Caulobacteraceae bacterium]